MQLTSTDITVLLEAIERWETDDLGGEMLGSLMGAMLCGKDEAAMAQMKADQKRDRDDRLEKQRMRKERGVLLRAKLIQIRDSQDADKLLSESRN